MGKTKTVLLFLHLAGLLLTVAKAERVLKDHMKFENDAEPTPKSPTSSSSEEEDSSKEYRIGSSSECRDPELLALMDLGDCDQSKFSTFLYDTVYGSATFLGPECTGRCVMKLHKQRIEGDGGGSSSSGSRHSWTREDCNDKFKLRVLGMSRSYCLLFSSSGPGDKGYDGRGYGGGGGGDPGSGGDRDKSRFPVYVYSGHHFTSHSLYIFFIVLIVACSCCGGFFRCRRPSAPDLYSYLEARSAAMNGGRSSLGGSNSAAIRMRRRRVSDSSLTMPVNATAAQRQAGPSQQTEITIPSYEEAVHAGAQRREDKPEEEEEDVEAEESMPALPPTYDEAVRLTTAEAAAAAGAAGAGAAGAPATEENTGATAEGGGSEANESGGRVNTA